MELINCIKAYIAKETIEYNNIKDKEELVKIALEQSLQTILYPVYKDISLKKCLLLLLLNTKYLIYLDFSSNFY